MEEIYINEFFGPFKKKGNEVSANIPTHIQFRRIEGFIIDNVLEPISAYLGDQKIVTPFESLNNKTLVFDINAFGYEKIKIIFDKKLNESTIISKPQSFLNKNKVDLIITLGGSFLKKYKEQILIWRQRGTGNLVDKNSIKLASDVSLSKIYFNALREDIYNRLYFLIKTNLFDKQN